MWPLPLFLCLPASAWNNDNDMRIIDVVYDDFYMTYTIKTKDGVAEILNKLYSKSVAHRSTTLNVCVCVCEG